MSTSLLVNVDSRGIIMIAMRKIFSSILLAACWFCGASFAAEVIDHEVIAAIKEEGIQHSQAMETLSYLTDVHGPRFRGTPGYYAAAEWARQQMSDWGWMPVWSLFLLIIWAGVLNRTRWK